MRTEDTELEAPIHEALTRDILVMGCERNAFTLLVLSCSVLGMVGFLDRRWSVVALAVGLFFAVVIPLQKATKEDPKAPVIWLRTLFEQRVYDAVPRWDQPRLKRRGGARVGEEN